MAVPVVVWQVQVALSVTLHVIVEVELEPAAPSGKVMPGGLKDPETVIEHAPELKPGHVVGHWFPVLSSNQLSGLMQ